MPPLSATAMRSLSPEQRKAAARALDGTISKLRAMTDAGSEKGRLELDKLLTVEMKIGQLEVQKATLEVAGADDYETMLVERDALRDQVEALELALELSEKRELDANLTLQGMREVMT